MTTSKTTSSLSFSRPFPSGPRLSCRLPAVLASAANQMVAVAQSHPLRSERIPHVVQKQELRRHRSLQSTDSPHSGSGFTIQDMFTKSSVRRLLFSIEPLFEMVLSSDQPKGYSMQV